MQSNADQLQEWLEGFSERLKSRMSSVADEVNQVLEQMGAVELDLKNTFNTFRNLSSSQFVENRVYEEDETESFSGETPKKDVGQPSMPTESYEDDILPRYEEAVATAWAAFENHRRDQASRHTRSKKRHLHEVERAEVLPYIIGTEDFARDIHCGLGDLRRKHQVANDIEFDSDVERDGANLAAELIGTETLSEEWSGTDSDASGFQEGSFEPAVSATLDFKAMLEAALRNPSLPYDGGSSNEVDNVFGQFGDNSAYLPNLPADDLSNATRTISGGAESRNDEIGGNFSEPFDIIVNKNHVPTTDQLPSEISVQSTLVGSGDNPKFLQPDQDQLAYSRTIQEILKQRFDPQSQAILKQGNRSKLPGDEDSMQEESSGFSHIQRIPGGLFDDDESDASFLTEEYVVVSNSNTEPTVPEGLFQKQLSLDLSQHSEAKSQSSSSFEASEDKYQFQAFLAKAAKEPLDQDVDTSFGHPEREASDISDIKVAFIPRYQSQASLARAVKDPLIQNVGTFRHSESSNKSDSSVSSIHKQSTFPTVTPSISSGLNVNTSSNPLQIRGGLFDDDDDDDDSSLFGPTVIKAEGQQVLRPWDYRSNKGLLDGVEDTEAKEQYIANLTLEQTGSNNEFQRINDSFPSESQKEISSGNEVVGLEQQPVFPVSATTAPRNSIPDVTVAKNADDFEFNSQNEGRVSRPQLPIHDIVAEAVRSTAKSTVDSDDDSNDTWSSSGSEEESVIGAKKDVMFSVAHTSGNGILMVDDSGPSLSQGETGDSVIDSKAERPSGNEYLGDGLMSTESTECVGDGVYIALSSQTDHEEPNVHFLTMQSRSFPASTSSPERVAITLDESPLLGSSKKELSNADQRNDEYDSSSVDQPHLVLNSLSNWLGPPVPQGQISSSGTGLVKETVTSIAKHPVEAENRSSERVKQKSSILATDFTEGPRDAENTIAEVSIQKPVNPSTGFVAQSLTSTAQNPLGASNMLTEELTAGVITPTTQLQNPLAEKKKNAEDGVQSLLSKTSILLTQNKSEVGNMITEGLKERTSKSELATPLSESGRFTTRRTFTTLFDDDDEFEDDLFGPKQQRGLFSGSGQNETRLSSHATVGLVPGRQEVVRSESPLKIQDTSFKLGGPSNDRSSLPFEPLMTLAENRDIQAAATSGAEVKPTADLSFHPKLTHSREESGLSTVKPGSKLSALLFGDDDDDDDNEDALFGPLGGRMSRRRNSLKSEKVVSLFGDTNSSGTSSRRATLGGSLFDD